jgi:phosphate starvation-inducible PhoH-like protein
MAKRKQVEIHTAGSLNIPRPTDEKIEPKKLPIITARSPNQKALIKTVQSKDVTICIGEAGSGKTFLAVALAYQAYLKGETNKIVITRPAVESYERIGFLPGTASEKLHAYLVPIYDEFLNFMEQKELDRLIKEGVIEIVPLGFMRGRNMKGYVILDEAQNCIYDQLVMFITRLCPDGKMIITGCPSQSDLAPQFRGGLEKIVKIVKDDDLFGVVHLGKEDIVRHPIVRRFLELEEKFISPRSLQDFWGYS